MQIVISSEEADARQTQADAAMALEQQAAQARTDANLWGTDEDSVEPFRQAQNEDGGLNLTWGRYEVTVDYDGAAKADVRVVSAGYQAFIENGEVHEEMEEENGRFEQLSFGFNLTDSTPDLYLASENPEDIVGVTVHKAGAGVFSADLCAYAALVGAVLTVLLALSWDKTERGCKNRRDAMILVCAAAFACMPLLWRGVYDGHDLLFHLNRIEGIASGLRNGQFPVRIHSSTLLGYGYAAPEFYPELFLYFPAALRNLGVSLSASVRVFEACINLATALVCYPCVRSLMRSRRAAVGASVLYTLCIYRLVNLYTRATLGESLAMIFFPIVLLGLYECAPKGRKTLAAAGAGHDGRVHEPSAQHAVLRGVLRAGRCAQRQKLFAEKRRILAILLAAGVTALCGLWFYVPMMQYTADGISTSVVLNAAENVHVPGSFFVGFAGDAGADAPEDFAYTIGVVPGLALLLGCALLLARRYAAGRGAFQTESDKLSLSLLALGALALALCTDFFPWTFLCSLRKPFSTFFMQMQFPWRFVSIAAPLLSVSAAWGYLREEKDARLGMAALIALCVVFSGYTMQTMVQQDAPLQKETYTDTRISQFEYTYLGTEKTALKVGDIRTNPEGSCEILAYEKRGTEITATVKTEGVSMYIEVPLLYYPGYYAEMDGQTHTVARGTNNMLRIYGTPEGGEGVLHVWYQPPTLWLVMQGISVLGALLLAWSLCRMRKRA
ncbi:MAG: hypothetical protein ACLUN5_02550 [Oscillospiraceae bacterium]